MAWTTPRPRKSLVLAHDSASRRTRNCMVVISGQCHRPLIQSNQACRRNAAKSYRCGTPCDSWWQPTLLVHHSPELIMAVLMTHLYIFTKTHWGLLRRCTRTRGDKSSVPQSPAHDPAAQIRLAQKVILKRNSIRTRYKNDQS